MNSIYKILFSHIILYSLLFPLEMYQGGFQGSYFLQSPDARGAALGGSNSAVSDNHFTALYNPALLADKTNQWHAGLALASMSLDRSIQALTVSRKVPPGAGIAFSVMSVKTGNIVGRNSFGTETDVFSWAEHRGVLSFGLSPSEHFSIGLNMNVYLHQSIEEVSSTGIGIDMGSFIPISDRLQVSIAIKNVLAKSNWKIDMSDGTTRDYSESFPMILMGALHFKPMPSIDLYFQEDYFFQQDLGYVGMDIKAGMEYQTGIVTSRAGFWNTQPSFGFGLLLSNIYSRLDYALLPGIQGEGMSHIFTWVFDK